MNRILLTVCCGTRIDKAQAFFFRDEPYCSQHGPALAKQELAAWNRAVAEWEALKTMNRKTSNALS